MKHITRSFLAFVIIAGTMLAGCNLLDVNNPNSLVEDDINQPVTAEFLTNGSEATVADGVSGFLAVYSVASDELNWVGSFDAWQDIMIGNFNDPTNQFVDQEYPTVSRARWWADDVIQRLNEFDSEGLLSDRTQLSRAYLYGAIIYVTIADMFDNFVFTDRAEGGPPIGEENMVNLYTTAVEYVDQGLSVSGISTELEAALLGMRARANYSRAMWSKMNPSVNTADPLINDSEAVADAQAALAVMGADYKYQLTFSPSTLNNYVAQQTNQRIELVVNPSVYIVADDAGRRVKNIQYADSTVQLQDPIDNIPDPVLYNSLVEFITAIEYAPITVVSAREMHLILAEAAAAGNGSVDFNTQINAIRSLNDLTDYSGQITQLEMLQHTRQVNLFLQGRRLHDMYRFDTSSPQWETNSTAESTPGTFFPISITECRANPDVSC
ncbi:RagB/SusD family nutrient uptake outer membrane protein [Balneolaceae bacterium YR4-1]|uniref:RagB/SusD family nutrient uptake outer membrane protein n=1 Tax=Halalkalibaculum roseum TaxID=2709311 RepID=A0A6M1T506_9BACT|nr:RagB/SusD family nutrient uptake outer membrane protein [Halalkalibaculum roseum]NGP77887.1 RagB/SusD family nutrient uptake outer membrane protein [Halalkalibaculum roseum]